MTPLRSLLPAARERIERLSRRDVLIMGASAVAMKGADIAFDKLVVDPLLERRVVESYRATQQDIKHMARFGSPQQFAALEAWRLGTDLPWFAEDRSTDTYVGPDGGQWVERQGEEVARLLWGRPHRKHIPLREQPDQAFGTWVERRMVDMRNLRQPAFLKIGGKVERSDGETVEQRYSTLLTPFPGGRLRSTSASWPKELPDASGQSPTRHIPGRGDRGHDRLVST